MDLGVGARQMFRVHNQAHTEAHTKRVHTRMHKQRAHTADDPSERLHALAQRAAVMIERMYTGHRVNTPKLSFSLAL